MVLPVLILGWDVGTTEAAIDRPQGRGLGNAAAILVPGGLRLRRERAGTTGIGGESRTWAGGRLVDDDGAGRN